MIGGAGRSPRGERGLKWRTARPTVRELKSRSPRGERGLKCCLRPPPAPAQRRSPRGERGLKLSVLVVPDEQTRSLPSRGAWIEIRVSARPTGRAGRSLPSRGAWIEILPSSRLSRTARSRSPRGERGLKWGLSLRDCPLAESLPSRGAWIEMSLGSIFFSRDWVAPLAGSVD